MKVRAAKDLIVIDPATGRKISNENFVEVFATRYWRRRVKEGAVEVDSSSVPGYEAPKKTRKKD